MRRRPMSTRTSAERDLNIPRTLHAGFGHMVIWDVYATVHSAAAEIALGDTIKPSSRLTPSL